MKHKHIIWDWNGTILDDVLLSVDVLNSILQLKNLPHISSEKYRCCFSFPVRDFYESLGIRLTLAEEAHIGKIFIGEYNSRRFECALHAGVKELIENMEAHGAAQSILSAYHRDFLKEAADHYLISPHMQNIAGLDNIHAATKVELGKNLVKSLNCEPHEILIIGDTDHDYDVAKACGADCVLFSGGHQSAERLGATGAKIFATYNELGRHIFAL